MYDYLQNHMRGAGGRGYFCVPTINSVWIPVAFVTESPIAGMVVMSKENVVRVKPHSGIQLVWQHEGWQYINIHYSAVWQVTEIKHFQHCVKILRSGPIHIALQIFKLVYLDSLTRDIPI